MKILKNASNWRESLEILVTKLVCMRKILTSFLLHIISGQPWLSSIIVFTNFEMNVKIRWHYFAHFLFSLFFLVQTPKLIKKFNKSLLSFLSLKNRNFFNVLFTVTNHSTSKNWFWFLSQGNTNITDVLFLTR